MRALILVLIGILGLVNTLAQCPIANFDLPVSACREQNIYLENLTVGSQANSWDVCSGDLQFTPTANFVVSGSSFFRARVFRMVQSHNGLWYGFAIDQPNNLLVRFDFGNSPDNTPTIVSLGNPESRLQNPLDIHFIQENGNWFALIANTSGNNLLRLNFGGDLTSAPTVTDLGAFSGSLQAPGGVYTIQEDGTIFAFVSNGSSSQITSLSFGNSILNTPTASTVSIPGSSGLRGLSFIKECDRWFGLVTSYNTNSLYYLDFQNGVNQSPVVNQLSIPGSSYSFPASIKLINEGGEFFTFVQSAFPAHVYRIAFGESILDLTGTFTNLGNFGISNDNSAFEIIGFNSSWRGFSIDLSGTLPGAGRLFKFDFPETCSTPVRIFDEETPPSFTFSNEGSYRITLKTTDMAGNLEYHSKIITISSGTSPDITFANQDICAGHPVQFTSINTSATIVEYQWSFGDSNTSSIQSPFHTYTSSGDYNVQLDVMGSNGCINTMKSELKIFNEPMADFLLPESSIICTNQNYQFVNTTVFDEGLNPFWEWSVNGMVYSTDYNFESAFTEPTSQSIKLKASIPGCATEMEKTIPMVTAGPLVNFSISGLCQGSSIIFTNESTGLISGYHWDFGDGQSSISENTEHNYTSSGAYMVTLTLYGESGCNNTGTKFHTVYSQPQPNFSLDLPPFSCAGSPSQFNDLTPPLPDSNLASWTWSFGDPANGTASQQNPTHTYTAAGDYAVSLEVASNYGCRNSVQKIVTISEPPTVDFYNDPACLSQGTKFTDASSSDIKAWLWSIQNSTYSTKNPTHIFNATGEIPVMLTVTANNNCINQISKPIQVPVPVAVNFSAISTCATLPATFTELTAEGTDPAVSWSWNFNGQSANGTLVQHTFSAVGNYPVTLSSTRASGCTYSITKSIPIIQPPAAQFTASSEAGAAPFAVGFTNLSMDAANFLWEFNDAANSASSEFSPSFVFNELGTYPVKLTAGNSVGCSDSFVKSIHVVIPEMNAAITDFELVPAGDGTWRATVTVLNKSNLAISNPEIFVDLSGFTQIKERLPIMLQPNQSATQMLASSLVVSNLQYACAEVRLPEDLYDFDNQQCATLTSESVTISPYPNPVSDELIVNWINNGQDLLTVTIYNSAGQIVMMEEYSPILPNLNQVKVDVSKLGQGFYYASLSAGGVVSSYRVAIVR